MLIMICTVRSAFISQIIIIWVLLMVSSITFSTLLLDGWCFFLLLLWFQVSTNLITDTLISVCDSLDDDDVKDNNVWCWWWVMWFVFIFYTLRLIHLSVCLFVNSLTVLPVHQYNFLFTDDCRLHGFLNIRLLVFILCSDFL